MEKLEMIKEMLSVALNDIVKECCEVTPENVASKIVEFTPREKANLCIALLSDDDVKSWVFNDLKLHDDNELKYENLDDDFIDDILINADAVRRCDIRYDDLGTDTIDEVLEEEDAIRKHDIDVDDLTWEVKHAVISECDDVSDLDPDFVESIVTEHYKEMPYHDKIHTIKEMLDNL